MTPADPAAKKSTLVADAVAGLTFALVNIPTAMAHAMLALVNPVLGTYTLIFGMPIGALFTSSIYMNISTTSAMAVAAGSILVDYPSDQRASALGTLVLLVGAIQLALGLFKLGGLIRFVPNSVMVGFSNGVAVLIILGQLSDLTGFESDYSGRVAQTLDLLLNPQDIQSQTLLIGLATLLTIFIISRTPLRKISAIIALVGITMLVAALAWTEIELIQDIATFPSYLPRPVLPDLRLVIPLLVPAFSLTMIGLMQGAAVSQGIPNPDGKFPDVSGDFTGQGAANLISGVFQGIPAGGSMSGTALNMSSGAKSRWTNIFAGIFVALFILFLDNFLGLIPMPALAALVLLAGFSSLQIPAAMTVIQTGKVSAAAMLLTFGLTLAIPLQYAVLLGISFSVLLYIFKQSNQVRVVQIVPVPGGLPLEQPIPSHLPDRQPVILLIFGSIFFAASKTIEDALPSSENSHYPVVILGLRGHYEIGSTFIKTIWAYSDALRLQGGKLVLAGIDEGMRQRLDRTGFSDAIGTENIYMVTEQLGGPINAALEDCRAWLETLPE